VHAEDCALSTDAKYLGDVCCCVGAEEYENRLRELEGERQNVEEDRLQVRVLVVCLCVCVI
jgi:hypothetical protein